MLKENLPLRKFGMNSVANFLNIGARAPILAEYASCWPAWREIQFGHLVWIWVMVIIHWLFFLLTKHLSYRRVAVVSWINYLILVVDLRGSSIQYQVNHAIDPLSDSSPKLHPMVSNAICFYDLYNILLP